MSLPPCKIIRGEAFNIQENKERPTIVFEANILSLNELLLLNASGHYRVCFVGSSCMYPVREGALCESMLGIGEIHEGNALYGYTKLLGWQFCRAASELPGRQWFTVIPSDIFGEAKSTHFVADMMRKFHAAKLAKAPTVTFWGTGTPIRHPLFKADFETILQALCESYEGTDPVNIAPPVSYAKSVGSIAMDIRDVVGYEGAIEWDADYADGQKVKILDNTRLTKIITPVFTPWKESLERAYIEIKNNL